MIAKNISSQRNFGLDLLRVVACYLVIQVHAGEFFYISENGTVISGADSFWVNLYNSVGRAAVPLFVMLTGFFLLPVKGNMTRFFRKRFTRVLIPFVVWCVLYAFYQFFTGQVDIQTACVNVLKIAVNFGTEVGHLWYVYMLIGLYLFAPIISPWIETASRKAVVFFLLIWAVTLFLPYIHLIFSEVWGECFWNPTPMLYYFTGFLGYAVLGYYIKKYWNSPQKWNFPVGLILLTVGYFITYLGFFKRFNTMELVSDVELTWGYGTINVAMMGLGLFLIFKNIKINNPDSPVVRMITDISLKSYGIYLLHIMLLNFFYTYMDLYLSEAACFIPFLAVITFITSYLIICFLSYLPKSKYLIG